MTTHPDSPIKAAVVSAEEQKAFETSRVDQVHGGRATMTADYLRSLIVAGTLAAVGTPRKLPMDLWPDDDPAVVQPAYERGVAVGFHMARFAKNPYLYRDELARMQAECSEAAYAAMAGMLGPVLATAVPEHPADGGSEGREHRNA